MQRMDEDDVVELGAIGGKDRALEAPLEAPLEARAPARARARHAARSTGVPWQSRVDVLCGHIIAGVPLEPACVLAGVSFRTIQDALARDADDARPIAEARARREADLAARLESLASDGRQHAGIAYLLERHAPSRWRQSSKVEVSGPDGGPMQSQSIAPPTEEELRARLEAVRRSLGG